MSWATLEYLKLFEISSKWSIFAYSIQLISRIHRWKESIKSDSLSLRLTLNDFSFQSFSCRRCVDHQSIIDKSSESLSRIDQIESWITISLIINQVFHQKLKQINQLNSFLWLIVTNVILIWVHLNKFEWFCYLSMMVLSWIRVKCSGIYAYTFIFLSSFLTIAFSKDYSNTLWHYQIRLVCKMK